MQDFRGDDQKQVLWLLISYPYLAHKRGFRRRLEESVTFARSWYLQRFPPKGEKSELPVPYHIPRKWGFSGTTQRVWYVLPEPEESQCVGCHLTPKESRFTSCGWPSTWEQSQEGWSPCFSGQKGWVFPLDQQWTSCNRDNMSLFKTLPWGIKEVEQKEAGGTLLEAEGL